MCVSAIMLNMIASIEMLKRTMSICLPGEVLVEVLRFEVLNLASNCFSDCSNCVGVIFRSPNAMNGRLRFS